VGLWRSVLGKLDVFIMRLIGLLNCIWNHFTFISIRGWNKYANESSKQWALINCHSLSTELKVLYLWKWSRNALFLWYQNFYEVSRSKNHEIFKALNLPTLFTENTQYW